MDVEELSKERMETLIKYGNFFQNEKIKFDGAKRDICLKLCASRTKIDFKNNDGIKWTMVHREVLSMGKRKVEFAMNFMKAKKLTTEEVKRYT